MRWIWIYLIVINIVTFILFAVDKGRAIKGKWRISEAALMCFSAIGGALGGISAMYYFRHKTRKPLFKYGLVIILVIQIALMVACFRYIWKRF